MLKVGFDEATNETGGEGIA